MLYKNLFINALVHLDPITNTYAQQFHAERFCIPPIWFAKARLLLINKLIEQDNVTFENDNQQTLPEDLAKKIQKCFKLTTKREEKNKFCISSHDYQLITTKIPILSLINTDFANLHNLNLSGCDSLLFLPSKIADLTNLKLLNLDYCSKLLFTPPEIEKLTVLEEFSLHSCSRLTYLPPQIGMLAALKRLELNDCSGLISLPPEIGMLAALEWLELYNCCSLPLLPSTIENLTNLQVLSLDCCSKLRLIPPQIGMLTALKTFSLNNCSGLTSLPPEITNLSSLQYILTDENTLKSSSAEIQCFCENLRADQKRRIR